MITRIVIPQAFENMEEATIGAWLKNEGDAVQQGDALCELITEKTTFPLEAGGAGVLLRIVAGEKSIVPVGEVIGIIGESGEPVPDIESENAALRERADVAKASDATQGENATGSPLSVPSLSVPTASAVSVTASAGAVSAGSRVRATPAARRAARERNIAIEDVAAAFPGKVLSEDDVAKFRG